MRNFSVPDGTRTIDFLVALNRAIRVDVAYSLRMEPGVQTPDFTLRSGIGSCRDSAWLLVSTCASSDWPPASSPATWCSWPPISRRSTGRPGRPPTSPTCTRGPRSISQARAGRDGPHVGAVRRRGPHPAGRHRAPAAAAPISGSTGVCETTLEFTNTVTRVHEDPRVTLPYTEAAWETICEVGRRVDERLTAGDVRLTVGGEPTFVSVDNQVDEEWTTAADGPHKRERASDLAARLKSVWAPQGLIHRGQGRWYPGEPLPRWQIGIYWRTDGLPLWTDEALLADPWAVEPASSAAKDEAAQELLAGVADSLGLPPSQVRPAYEDPLARLAAKVRKPQGDPVDPGDDIAEDTGASRDSLMAHLDESTTAPRAFVLPLHRRDDDAGWASADWRLRRGRVVLVEGDSPAGLRLPLASISWRPPRASFMVDPGTVTDALAAAADAEDAELDESETAPTTALVAEVRDGLLYVFLPPTEALEHFVDLIARIEAAAAKADCPVVIEGYGPPPDPRLQSTTITPDPGVIEVNIAPAASYAEQTQLLETLYDEARLARLSTESFDFDGTHGGTGGGNHITLGGVTPADSPMLRRPDLLVSLLTYWQRHPSLSYLFAGRFVGTTSQAPRVDEGRGEALYELEIAFAEIARLASSAKDGTAPPWVADRALRHLLTDITGNTHRAEFCIDKLYSPDSPRGRLGLLELRGFEMPPHLRMAMVQSLLVRSLVTWFWDEPLRAPLIRHGANLHGRYLLPHFLIHDIADVAAELRAHGIAFETSWLDPFTEFRFPRIGTAVFDGVEIELRGAIEPWNTLGEESTATGTARYVDSSVERIQIRIIGADRHRYVVTVNGYPVPLLATNNPDIHVGGVRYKAWQPPSALHPTITVDVPLRIELIDLTTGTSRGGCTYHVAHPGGMAYDEPPVNAVAAESRRARRFEATGFTPGKLDLSDLREKQARIFTDIGAPGILDLRRVRTVQQ